MIVSGLEATIVAGTTYLTVRAAPQQDAPFDSPAVLVPENSTFNKPSLAADEIRADRSHAMILDQAGGFSGHLINADLVTAKNQQAASLGVYTVRLLQSGVVAAEIKTESDGTFSFSSLTPGTAGLLAYNDTGLVLFGLRLIEQDNQSSSDPESDTQFSKKCATVAGPDVSLARQLIAAGIAGSDIRFSGELVADDQ